MQILPKSRRMKTLWQEALTDLQDIKQASPDLPPIAAQAALFYAFQHAMFLGFKTLKAYLKEEGLIPLTPKQHLEMACQAGWISPQEEDAWWVLLMAWLEVGEVYEKEQAERLAQQILQYDGVLLTLLQSLPQ